jgi:hypothetical protein
LSKLANCPAVSRIQKYATYPIGAFLTAHLTNTAIIPLVTQSVPASESYLLLTRPYYQSPLAESLLVIIPIAVHISSGLALQIVKRRHLLKRYGAETRKERRKMAWPKLSGISILGLSLIPLVSGHVLVNRITPLIVEGGSSGVGLGFVSHGAAKHPAFANFAYATLIGVGSFHFVWGIAKFQGWLPENVSEESGYGNKKGRTRRWLINAVAAAVASLWMAGGMGVVLRGGPGAGWEAKGWDEILSRVPVVGPYIF